MPEFINELPAVVDAESLNDLRHRMHQAKIFKLIQDERDRQDLQWGANREQDGYLWNAILTEEVGEVAHEVLEEDQGKLITELIQVAAVATAWLESLVRKV